MDADSKKGFLVAIYAGCATIAFLWSCSFLWHIGPDMGRDPPWGSMPYYFSTAFVAIGIGAVVFFCAAMLSWPSDQE